MQYSFGKSALKGLKAVGVLVGITALTAFTSSDFAQAAEKLPAAALLLPIIQWIAVFGIDWLKHRNLGA